MKVEHVHPNHVVKIWPQVEPFLTAALVHGQQEYSVDQLKVFLVSGAQALLVAHDDQGIKGAATIETCRFPNATIAFITAIGGRGIANKDAFSQLKAWCTNAGFTAIRGATFESAAQLWKRFESKEIYRVVEIKL